MAKTAAERPNLLKLARLMVNVVNWNTNQQWRRALTDFVPDDIREERARKRKTTYPEYTPVEYSWTEFEDWITRRLGYDRAWNVVIFCPFGMKNRLSSDVADVFDWQAILNNIAKTHIHVPEFSDICFVIRTLRVPLYEPLGHLSHLYPENYVYDYAAEPAETLVEFSLSLIHI